MRTLDEYISDIHSVWNRERRGVFPMFWLLATDVCVIKCLWVEWISHLVVCRVGCVLTKLCVFTKGRGECFGESASCDYNFPLNCSRPATWHLFCFTIVHIRTCSWIRSAARLLRRMKPNVVQYSAITAIFLCVPGLVSDIASARNDMPKTAVHIIKKKYLCKNIKWRAKPATEMCTLETATTKTMTYT